MTARVPLNDRMRTRFTVATAMIAASITVASLVAFAAPGGAGAAAGTPKGAAASPLDSSFYRYTGTVPLAQIERGTVLKTRTVDYHVAGLALPLKTVQLLYRTTDAVGEPAVNVTSIVRPLLRRKTPQVVSYQSFYDSLNPADEPSAAIAGGRSMTDGIAYVETALFVPLLLAGYTIVIPDTEGQGADFAAGPEYGRTTLDSLRAAFASPAVGLTARSRVGMLGYSGGAIATGWAAELAPSYAPEISAKLVGAAMGGVLVDPAHNLHYIDGSSLWAGVMPMAIIGLARAYHVDLTPYMSSYGLTLYRKLQKASITDALGHYPGLTWAALAKPEFARPESVPAYVQIANQLIMGSGGTPGAPLMIGQGIGGYQEGTPGNKPGIGAGDGVMIAGDVRTLAREYCGRAVPVEYRQYPLSHTLSATVWLPQAYTWLLQRFAGGPAPSNCSSIPPGNPLAPITPAGG